jgi:hypothetical protein
VLSLGDHEQAPLSPEKVPWALRPSAERHVAWNIADLTKIGFHRDDSRMSTCPDTVPSRSSRYLVQVAHVFEGISIDRLVRGGGI